jgi:hypothetical protein
MINNTMMLGTPTFASLFVCRFPFAGNGSEMLEVMLT